MSDHDSSPNNSQVTSRSIRPSGRRFDQDFSRHVTPKLLNLITALAPMVALEVYGFDEALSSVWRVAWRYGAAQLSALAQEQLDDWIAREILARIDDPLPAELITPARLEAVTLSPSAEG